MLYSDEGVADDEKLDERGSWDGGYCAADAWSAEAGSD
jgi:hypothetical protein